jgi:membrane protein
MDLTEERSGLLFERLVRRRFSLWWAGLAAALLAFSFRRRAHGETRPTGLGRRPTEGGRGRAAEGSRGRAATTPSEIPARGWKDIFWRVYNDISECRVLAIAAGVTFYVLLAIFPAIAALVSIYGLFADPATISSQLDAIANFAPGGAIDVIRDQMTLLASQAKGTLGLSLIIGLAVSLWSANAGIKALFDALNVVYGEKEKRSFVRLNAISLALTIGAIVFLLIAIAAVVGIPVALNYIGLEQATDLLIKIARWPILFVCVSFAIACLYRYGPSREMPQWRWVSWGSVFAALTWIAASLLFSWYAANFGSYNRTYGSLGAVIGFMTWIWISSTVVLIGALIDAEMEHQTARDTTTGSPKPMGFRGARMADTLGPAQG